MPTRKNTLDFCKLPFTHGGLIILLSWKAVVRHSILTCVEPASSILIGSKVLVASYTVLIYCFSFSQLKHLPDGIAATAYRTGGWRYLHDANSFLSLSIHELSLNDYMEKVPRGLRVMPCGN